jgi:uncharacterized membrane protein YfcA
MIVAYLWIGLMVGLLVGFMGVGGGVILVPALVYLLGMDQHVAQGTSLFLQLPPLGLGALLLYRKKHEVDWKAGLICALGILLGGSLGSTLAIRTASGHLQELFGLFLILAAAVLWRKTESPDSSAVQTL